MLNPPGNPDKTRAAHKNVFTDFIYLKKSPNQLNEFDEKRERRK